MPKPNLSLTRLEATALSLAIDCIFGDDQDLEAVLGPDQRLWAAAFRASAKLDRLLLQLTAEPSDGSSAD